MKNKLNIFSDSKIRNFLSLFLSEYDLTYIDLEDIDQIQQTDQPNIIIINNNKDENLINLKNLNGNYLLISNLNSKNFDKSIKYLKSPLSISNIKNTIENFLQNLEFKFHDISIDNQKIINLKNKSFCYLTKAEFEILIYLLREKEKSKNFIKQNILNIRSNVETNSLESHLTRIRKKLNKINTKVKIQTKSEKLFISI